MNESCRYNISEVCSSFNSFTFPVGAGGFNPNTTASASATDVQKDGILPVCIRQMILVDDDVKMFNFAYALVSLVVIVRKIEYTSTKITCTIEDHTGRMEAHFWLDDEGGKAPKITQNAYARIIGTSRKVGDQNVIVIYHAEEVENINEVTTHRLEILFARFKAEQLSKGGGLMKDTGSKLGGMSSTSGNTNEPMETNAATTYHGLAGKDNLIYQAISVNSMANNGSGFSRTELYATFPKLPNIEVDNSIDYLIQEGHIYSTVSSDNFKTVE